MIPSKKGIELSINFLVTLIIAIVVFGMGLFLANMIFGGGESAAEQSFEDFDKQVGELACYAADNVCVHVKTATIRRGKFKVLAVTVKNALQEQKEFKVVVLNTKMVDAVTGDAVEPPNTELLLYGLKDGRIETLEKGEKKTFGIGIEVPEDAESGQYTLDVWVSYSPPTTWEVYTPTQRPYKIFINVP